MPVQILGHGVENILLRFRIMRQIIPRLKPEPSSSNNAVSFAGFGHILGTNGNWFGVLLIQKRLIWCPEGDLNPHGG